MKVSELLWKLDSGFDNTEITVEVNINEAIVEIEIVDVRLESGDNPRLVIETEAID